MSKIIRIGTRSSKLALWQANFIADLIRARHDDIDIELVTIRTRGDKDRESSLPAIGGKGVFTQELENALRRGEINCAVHSLKDLPTEDSADLLIAATPERGDPRDALVSRDGLTLDRLPFGASIGSGSPRRRAQLLRHRPDLTIRNIRGNVPTRVQKLFAPESPYDAIVLAVAGLERLGLRHHISEIFEIECMTSAAGQGALALQCVKDSAWSALFMSLNDDPIAQATEAERAFLGALAGGCSVPVGAYAHIDDGMLKLLARVTALDGTQQIDVSGETRASDGPAGNKAACQLGVRLAEQALAQGAGPLLQDLLAEKDDR